MLRACVNPRADVLCGFLGGPITDDATSNNASAAAQQWYTGASAAVRIRAGRARRRECAVAASMPRLDARQPTLPRVRPVTRRPRATPHSASLRARPPPARRAVQSRCGRPCDKPTDTRRTRHYTITKGTTNNITCPDDQSEIRPEELPPSAKLISCMARGSGSSGKGGGVQPPSPEVFTFYLFYLFI